MLIRASWIDYGINRWGGLPHKNRYDCRLTKVLMLAVRFGSLAVHGKKEVTRVAQMSLELIVTFDDFGKCDGIAHIGNLGADALARARVRDDYDKPLIGSGNPIALVTDALNF